MGTTGGTGTLSGSCAITLAGERVYAWTPTANGISTIQTCGGGTTYDSVLYVRTGSCTGPEIACNDDTTGCYTGEPNNHHGSSITLTVTTGQTYYIVVDGHYLSHGMYVLTVTPPGTCGNGVVDPGEQCDGTASSTCRYGRCNVYCVCEENASGLPDLMATISNVTFDWKASVGPEAVVEGCTHAATGVDLLNFDVDSWNVGNAIIELGNPLCPTSCTVPLSCANPLFVCGPVGGYTFGRYPNWSRYDLLNTTGQVLVTTYKGVYDVDDGCGHGSTDEGINCGCYDAYTTGDDCQYLDVTDVPDGDYTLRVTIDSLNQIAEENENNNITLLPVSVTRPTPAPTGSTATPSTTLTSSQTPIAATSTPTATPRATVTQTPASTPTRTATATTNTTATPNSTSSATTAPTASSTPADACAGATIIPAAGGTFTGTTAGGSTLNGSCYWTITAPEQVFQWTPAVSGVATIDTCGSGTGFDTVVYVRSGSCTSGTEVACNDDTNGCTTGPPDNNNHHGSYVTPVVTAGQTYFIVVDGAAGVKGTFGLVVIPPSGSTATPTRTATLASTPSPTITMTATATPSATATPAPTTTPTSSPIPTATLTAAATPSATATVVPTATNSPVPSATQSPTQTPTSTSIASATSTRTPTATPSSTAATIPTVTATSPATATSTPSSLSTPTPTPQPTATATSTTACGGTSVISAAGGTFTGATTGTNTLSGSCGSSGSSPEKVFEWTPSVSGTATVATCGSATLFDTVLYMRSGSCDTGTQVACNDDACPNGQAGSPSHASKLTPLVTAGQTYFIVVDGFAGASGAFTLTVTPPVPPVACAAATVIPASGGVFTGTTSGTSSLAAACAITYNSPETVFQWTPSTSGTATIQTCGASTTFDTVIYVISGDCATGPQVVCNDDACPDGEAGAPNHASRVTPTVTAGHIYFIVVDGFYGSSGTFSLSVAQPP